MLILALLGAIPAGISVLVVQNVNSGEYKIYGDIILCLLFMHTYIIKIVLPVYWSRLPNVCGAGVEYAAQAGQHPAPRLASATTKFSTCRGLSICHIFRIMPGT